MVVIVGGFKAGKRAFARELGYGDQDILELDLSLDQENNYKAYKVILIREMGCGLVPIDAEFRAQREKTGRLACELARNATAVYRVTCGIGMRIK